MAKWHEFENHVDDEERQGAQPLWVHLMSGPDSQGIRGVVEKKFTIWWSLDPMEYKIKIVQKVSTYTQTIVSQQS